MRRRCFVLLLLSSFAVSTLTHASDKRWIEIRSPHFRILTDGNEKDARRVAREFEQMHELFEVKIRRFKLDAGPPLLVFAAKDWRSASSLNHIFGVDSPTPILGIYHEGWEKQFAVFRNDSREISSPYGADNGMNVIYHEYVHSILHTNTRWLPMWMDEGFADFFGSTHFEKNEVVIGYPSPRMRTLKDKPLITIDAMMQMPRNARKIDTSMFYAESWAMIHYMEFGTGMGHGNKLDEFYGHIDQGMDQKKAFEEVFGDPNNFYGGLHQYLTSPTLQSAVFYDLPRIDESQFAMRTLSAAESEAETAGYHVWMHDFKDARPLAEQAVKDDPKLALAHENLGFVDFGEGKDADAAKEFSTAFDLDPKLYLSLFYKTMLNASQGKALDDEAIYSGCLRVLQINPRFAEAYVQLALYQLRQGTLANALLMARKASDLAPNRAGYYLLAAHVLELMGQYQQAGEMASFVAERWTGPDHDEAVSIWDKIPQSQRPQIENLEESIPAGTQTTEGTVESVTCADKEKDKDVKFELVLNQAGKSVHFHSDGGFPTGYSDTIWYGRDHFSLCHHLEGMRAIVRYKPAKDATYAGDVAELEIRVELPTPSAQPSAAAAAQTK